MPFEPQKLTRVVIEDLEAFLRVQDFPDLYKTYSWQDDSYLQGFSDIYRLESLLVSMDKASGITLSAVKSVVQWGRLPNEKRISGPEVVLPPHSLHTNDGNPVPALADNPLSPLLAMQDTVFGLGPTYLSKVLRFGLPQQYGAIDTRCVRVFGRGDAEACRHHWIELKTSKPRKPGSRWSISKMQKLWPSEYVKWLNILRYFANRLPPNCPHPPSFVISNLRGKGVWECADVEMALFSYASKFT